MDPTPIQRLEEELIRPPFNRWLAPVALAADELDREVRVRLDYRPEYSHHPTQPIFHGGVLAALIDMTGHAAVAVWHGRVTPTISLQVEFVRPAAGLRVEARGVLRRMGRSIARADVELTVEDKLVALGRGTFSTGDERT